MGCGGLVRGGREGRGCVGIEGSLVPGTRPAQRPGDSSFLAAVLTMTVCAMLGGARSLYAMAQWGREHRQLDSRQAGPGFGQAGEEGGLVLGACRQFQQTPGLRPVLRLAPVQPVSLDFPSRVPGSGVRGRGSGERETTASSLAGKQQAREKEDNGGQGKDGPAGAIAQGGNGR